MTITSGDTHSSESPEIPPEHPSVEAPEGTDLPPVPSWLPPDEPGTPDTPDVTHREPRRRTALIGVGLAGIVALSAGAGALAGHAAGDGGSSSAATVLRASGSGTTAVAAAAGTTEAAAAVIGPSVVTIEVSGTQAVDSGNAFGFGGGGSTQQQVSDTGSGIVLRSDGTSGYILTNNHVVAAAENGGDVHVTFSDGKTVTATIVGFDATSDLAVIKVDASAAKLVPAVFADSDSLKVGQGVIAVGAPLGLSNTVTEGIVSTTHRPVTTGESGATAQSVIDAIQTDAAINPGNSGGALVDLSGHVVGINSAIASTGSTTSGQSGNIGVGFAIPSNDAAKVADQLIAQGHATHSIIGINVSETADDTTGIPGIGATVGQVSSGGPAANAGIQAGDVITKVDDRLVTDSTSLIVAVRSHDPGDKVTLTYTRGGATKTATVTLGSATS